MATYGFVTSDSPVVGDVIAGRETDMQWLEYVQPDDTVREAIRVMREHDISQVPVAKGSWPLSAAEVVGSVDELHLMERAFETDRLLDQPVFEVMQPPLTTIGIGQPVRLAVERLDTCQALLVLDGGRPDAVITRSDLLRFVSPEGS
jgi:cystathionine beta-synthase